MKSLKHKHSDPEKYMNPYLAGVILGVVIMAAFFFSGEGLGGSGAFKDIVKTTVVKVAPEYAASTHYFKSATELEHSPLKTWLVFEVLGVLLGGIISGEDRVLVGPDSAGSLDDAQFLLNAGVTSGATELTIKTGTETLGTGTQSATDTPSTGTIRVLDDTGVYQRVTYTGFSVAASTMTFTGLTNRPTAAIDNEVFISYIDDIASGTSISFTTIYNGARTLFARVRDGGASPIKTFENTVALGASISAIRTSDA